MNLTDRQFMRTFVLILGGLAVMGILFIFLARALQPNYDSGELASQAEQERIAPVGDVAVTEAGGQATSAGDGQEGGGQSGEQVVQAACGACHQAGVAGAPKIGAEDQWAPRLDQGMGALVAAVKNGKGAMPPGGGGSFSDAEIEAAIQHMLVQSGIDNVPGGGQGGNTEQAAQQGNGQDSQGGQSTGQSADQADSQSGQASGSDQQQAGGQGSQTGGSGQQQASGQGGPAGGSQQQQTGDQGGPAGDSQQQQAGGQGGQTDGSGQQAGGADAAAGKQLVQQVCGACHNAGVAGAPKIGDQQAWSQRAQKGMDKMVQITVFGKGAMPPRGGSNASDAEIRAAIQHMLNQSGL